MVTMSTLWLSSPGCDGSGDDDRTVAGRTRSLSRSGDVLVGDDIEGQLRVRLSHEQPTGLTSARLTARVGGRPISSAILRLPTAEEVAMVASHAAMIVMIEGTPRRGRVTYVTTGGGGRNLYPVHDDPRLAYAESVFHFLEVTVEGRELRLRAIEAGGAAFDALTSRKP
jgi:hypothetical protein